jgi:hypothetical protein
MRCGTHTGFGETNDKQPRRWGIGKKKKTERNHEREEGQLLSIPLNSKPRKQKNKEKNCLPKIYWSQLSKSIAMSSLWGFQTAFLLSLTIQEPESEK